MNALVTASEQMVIMMIMIFIEGDIKMIKLEHVVLASPEQMEFIIE